MGGVLGTPISSRPYGPSGSGGSHHSSSGSHRKGSFDGNGGSGNVPGSGAGGNVGSSGAAAGGGGGGSDDSMHEKYFKSVENTPITRRRHTTSSKSPLQQQKQSSDSSPQSPISPQQQQQVKVQRPSALSVELSPGSSYQNNGSNKSSHKNSNTNSSNTTGDHPSEPYNVDGLKGKADKYQEKIKQDRAGKISPGAVSVGGKQSPYPPNIPASSSSSHPVDQTNSGSTSKGSAGKDHFSLNLNQSNLDRHNRQLDPQQTLEKKSSGSTHTVASNNSSSHNAKHGKKSKNYSNHNTAGGTGFDFDYDNGNTSPLYCNWDKVILSKKNQ